MLTIHLYGKLRKLSSNPRATENSTIKLPFKTNETLKDCLSRIGINLNDTRDLFINHRLSSPDEIIPYDDSRLGIFPSNMGLIDGGLYIRYCGYRSKNSK